MWLRAPAGRVGVKGALAQVAKYERLVELRAGDVDLSSLPPSRRRQLAAQARRLDAQGLARRDSGPVDGPARRHPILLVALAELYLDRGDELLDLFCRLLAGAQRHANTTVDRQRRKTARTRDELVDLATTLSRIILADHDAGRDPTDRIAREVGLGRLREAAAVSPGQVPPLEQEQLDVLHQGHNSLTRALSAILDAMTLRCHPADQPLLDAVALVRDQRRRRVLIGAPIEVLPHECRAWVLDDVGRVLRTRYEVGLWCAIRAHCATGGSFGPRAASTSTPPGSCCPTLIGRELATSSRRRGRAIMRRAAGCPPALTAPAVIVTYRGRARRGEDGPAPRSSTTRSGWMRCSARSRRALNCAGVNGALRASAWA